MKARSACSWCFNPEKEDAARAVFEKWELDFATIGVTTDDLAGSASSGRARKSPICRSRILGDEAPEYDRPWVEPKKAKPLKAPVPPVDIAEALLRLVGSSDLSCRRWVYEQYDTLIQANGLQLPGGDAGVVRVDGHPTKALAFTSDVNPRYCDADPFEGGKQAVAECWRNLTATGAEPLAATDNLNFGNPEKPEAMGQFVRAIQGVSEACRTLEFPIVSGNVSLYNETNGTGILPTPTIAGVGLIPDAAFMAKIAFASEGDAILLVGAPDDWGTHLGQSRFLSVLFGRDEGTPPPVDLAHEKQVGDFVRGLIRSGKATACHDLSDGGLGVALAEMAMASGIGAKVTQLNDENPAAVFFGEDQGRYLITISRDDLDAVQEAAKAAGILAPWIGTTGGDAVQLGEARAVPVSDLVSVHEDWFPRFMG